jgi:hypothetical protein
LDKAIDESNLAIWGCTPPMGFMEWEGYYAYSSIVWDSTLHKTIKPYLPYFPKT